MKSLVFVHDGPLYYDTEGNYYEFAYHELLHRYSYLAEKITFLMRTKPIDDQQKYTFVPSEINVISVPNFKTPTTFLKNRPIAEQIIEKCISENDYIILRMQSSIAHIALKYIKKYNKPYIVESVSCAWDSYYNHGFFGKIVAPYMYITTKRSIKNADFVYYVTREFLQKRYPTNGKAVSCSNVVIGELCDDTLLTRLNKIKNFNYKNHIVIGTAAAIDTRYKGQEYVIRSIPALVEKGYNVEYHLAGGVAGESKNTFLRDLANKIGVGDRVIFWGSLSSEKIIDFYDYIDIYVQPSKQEGLPRAVIEAMSRGCPCIGSDIAGIPELIQKEFLFKKGNSRDFIRVFEKMVHSNLKTVATRNFEKARQYERSKLVKKRNEFYDEFLNENKR